MTLDEQVRARILALSSEDPPPDAGLSRWSVRTLVNYLEEHEGIYVSRGYIANLWRDHGITPQPVQGLYPVRIGPYWVDDWTQQALRDVAAELGRDVTESDVVRRCLAHGLRELYGKEGPQ